MVSTEILVTTGYVRTMASYNKEMNRALYDAAGRLGDAERRRETGAFWGSIHGTLNHLLWADRTWMARFDGWPPPPVLQKESAAMIADFATLKAEREAADAKIEAWAARIDEAWLAADQTWFSGTTQREMRMKRSFLVMHVFNHQTHHRGQVHAMITAANERTGDTDLFLLMPVLIAAGVI
jgi:uncharacterized damage-inducible protein DinB